VALAKRDEELINRYNLRPVFDDIQEIVDLPSAITKVLVTASIVPVVVTVLSYVLAGGLDAWLRIPFALMGGVVSLGAAILLGVVRLSRERFGSVQRAIARTLTSLEAIHTDIDALRDGERTKAQVTDLAQSLVTGVAFPAMDSAALMLPLPKFVTGPLVTAAMHFPKKAVEKGVMSSIESMQWDELSAKIEDSAKAAVASTDLVKAASSMYAEAQARIESTTRRAMQLTQGPLIAVLAISILPILVWLLLALAL